MSQGEFYLYPAKVSGFTSWQEIDKTLNLIIKPHFLREIAIKTESINPNRIELLPIFKKHDTQIEQLAHLFLNEIQNQNIGSQLYLESLANVLGVHLLRNYSAFKPIFCKYTDGLADYKLDQTIDYIKSNLDKKLSLKSLAENIDMGRYYFATQFKQAMGISPYQYIIEQRIAKAKKLLKKRKRSLDLTAYGGDCAASLSEIALDCGFSSQSHFSKVFRQYVGITPKQYREQQ
ncbi:MAG: AraC family transcriptional regulator [Cyanobacteria bacterium P01_G01_bin.39]